jgi:hypothetical protein
MKNYVFTVLLLSMFVVASVMGQDSLKSFDGRWSTELNFNPFDGNLDFNNAIKQIKVRYFEPAGTAWRFAVTANYQQDNSSRENVYGTNPYDESNRMKSFLLGLNIGREKHFRSSKRLSPYLGGEFAFAFKTSSHYINTDEVSTKIEGAWQVYQSYQYYDSYYNRYYTAYTTTFQERGFVSVGSNFVLGFDFYISKNLYFGYELMFGLEYTSYSDVDITNTYTPGNTPTNPPTFPDYSDESWFFGPKLLNGVRFGFVF